MCGLKVAEMVTDNELLKERLADAKRHLQATTTGETHLKEATAALQARSACQCTCLPH